LNCNICHSTSELLTRALVLGRHESAYYRCTGCGFIQTEEPYWLSEAYSAAITASDVGLVRRNFELSAVAKVLITLFFNPRGHFVDYAGGYGLFVRLMRDCGYDFSWNDKYSENIFAQGFEASPPGGKTVELVTAFEVLEHLVDPTAEVERIFAYSRNILFTTLLLPDPPPQPGEWWYYGLEHGQHIAFYTRCSLALLAERAGLNFYTNGSSMHLFTEKRLSQPLFSVFARYKAARFLAPLAGRTSLVPADYTHASGSSLDRRI